MPDDMDY